MKYTFKDVLEFFYGLSEQERHGGQWVLSTETVEALKDQALQSIQSIEAVPHGWPVTMPLTLVGKPIRIDESVKGLAYESPRSHPTWRWVRA